MSRTSQNLLGALLIFIIFIFVAPLASPYDFLSNDWEAINSPPSLTTRHYFGTDSIGRDVYLQTIKGGQTSLAIAALACSVSAIIGVLYGATSALAGGLLDRVMMRLIDILYALPFMFVVILLTVLFGRHMFLLFVGIGAIHWLDMARLIRGQTKLLKRQAYFDAAIHFGATSKHLLIRHLLPNLSNTILVYLTLSLPGIIITESFLSFLGLGVQAPATSWGVLINEGIGSLESHWWNFVFPMFFFLLFMLLVTLLNHHLGRDYLSPKNRAS